jgi:hypothetical protein
MTIQDALDAIANDTQPQPRWITVSPTVAGWYRKLWNAPGDTLLETFQWFESLFVAANETTSLGDPGEGELTGDVAFCLCLGEEMIDISVRMLDADTVQIFTPEELQTLTSSS